MDDSVVTDSDLLTGVEAALKKRFNKEEASRQRVPSSAHAAASSERVDQLVLPDEMRAKMPFTKDKYLVRENPQLVQWEREVRKFLRQLSTAHGHRVSAVMIYEWCTGIRVAELVAEGGNANSDLRKINAILRHYFPKRKDAKGRVIQGGPYSTYIMGRKVPNAYKVRQGWFIRRHRPLTMTLLAEYYEKTLYP